MVVEAFSESAWELSLLGGLSNERHKGAEETPTPISLRAWFGFFVLFASVMVAKIWIAANMGLHSDAAFYWWEAQYPAISYSEVPFLTPFLIKLGTLLAGDTLFGVRLMFLGIGAVLPFSVYALARTTVGPRDALVAATFTLLVPLPAITGILAVPDVPLLLLQILCLTAFIRATTSKSVPVWLLTGGIAALGFSAHYRFVFFMLGALIYLFLTKNGRANLRSPGPWLGGLVASIGLVPIYLFNATNSMAGLSFHFVDRHKWEFDPSGLSYILEQALWVTPFIFVALAATFVLAVRSGLRGSDRHALLTCFAGAGVLAFMLAKPWTVNSDQFSQHWTQFGYVPLLVLLPETLRKLRRKFSGLGGRLAVGLIPLSGAAAVCLLLFVSILSPYYDRLSPGPRKLASSVFFGWDRLANEMLSLQSEVGLENAPLVSDNIVTTSYLAFWTRLPGDVFTLDNRSARYLRGRQPQIQLWQMDTEGLQAKHSGEDALIVVLESKIDNMDDHMCSVFERVEPAGSFKRFEGGKTYRFFVGRGIQPTAGTNEDCTLR